MLLFCKKQNSLKLRDASIALLSLYNRGCVYSGHKIKQMEANSDVLCLSRGRGMRIKVLASLKTLNSMVRAPIGKRISYPKDTNWKKNSLPQDTYPKTNPRSQGTNPKTNPLPQ
ncbi:hypothetical protein UABAM_00245 [Candidatus Uabimicrobium amorphum]|uniref:Uncharacterized protein n=1 Tax=Uabimicrobium amorphum TaxID=2596890 RepID=A0A5S9F1A7_UABAM|nr:hypothetical protein UABAM_00245 [Candidatus Uabimicrobium amorphum]